MKKKIKDAAIQTLGYLIAGMWIVGLVGVPILMIAGVVKLITMMFGG